MPQTRLRFTVVSQALAGGQYELPGDAPISVGRTKDNTLVLDHKSVSRRHARIEPNGDGWLLVDLDSHNGTRVGEELVSERSLEPGEELTFGEVTVRFTPVDAAESTPSEALPAVVGDATETALPAQPLSVGDVFPEAAAAAAEEAEGERGLGGTLAYGLTLLVIIVVGLLAIWKVSQPPPAEPVVGVQLKAGQVLPVNLSKYRRDAQGRRATFGVTEVTRIGRPTDEHVAFARPSKFGTIVVVKALAVGTTDIPVYGPPRGTIILRVLVRGKEPEPEWHEWLDDPREQRVARAKELMSKAERATPSGDAVTRGTTQAIRYYEQAVELFGSDPQYRREAALATRRASELREQREAWFNVQAQDVATLQQQGRWQDVDAKMQELMRVFNNPEEASYHVVRAEYERVRDQILHEQRTEQERR
ncbi:MAG: FHA domain-containing protein [bacterium]